MTEKKRRLIHKKILCPYRTRLRVKISMKLPWATMRQLLSPRPAVACSVKICPADRAVRLISTFQPSSNWPEKVILPELPKRLRKNALPGVCGRSVPRKTSVRILYPGQKHEPVAIGRIERFCRLGNGQRHGIPGSRTPTGKGSCGWFRPCGSDLRRRPGQTGHRVTIFEGPAYTGRRIDVRDSRVSPAQGHCSGGNR